jgi:predicted transcriptional regulator
MYLDGSKYQPNTAQETIDTLKTDMAVVKNELEHMKQRAAWIQTIFGGLILAQLLWFGQSMVSSATKTNPVVPTISQR